jgi:PIN domain nuclease of toxin-antitoxin system
MRFYGRSRAGNTALAMPARTAIGDVSNTVFVSAASAWVVATKFRLGKLPGAVAILRGFSRLKALSACRSALRTGRRQAHCLACTGTRSIGC